MIIMLSQDTPRRNPFCKRSDLLFELTPQLPRAGKNLYQSLNIEEM